MKQLGITDPDHDFFKAIFDLQAEVDKKAKALDEFQLRKRQKKEDANKKASALDTTLLTSVSSTFCFVPQAMPAPNATDVSDSANESLSEQPPPSTTSASSASASTTSPSTASASSEPSIEEESIAATERFQMLC